jgi:hypothetical protein
MRVAERIQHVETFLARMREQRGGGQAADVGDRQEPQGLEKEFDRTCDYIVDTINALKTSTAAPAASSWNKAPSARSAARHWAWRCAWAPTTTR